MGFWMSNTITRPAGGGGRIEQESMDRMMMDVDPSLMAFLHDQIDSFVKWDLIQFFHRNPNTMDTADNIAQYIGRAGKTVHKEIAQLCDGGILEKDGFGDITVYSLSRDPEVRDQLHEFGRRCDDQQFKLKAVYHILRSMR